MYFLPLRPGISNSQAIIHSFQAKYAQLLKTRHNMLDLPGMIKGNFKKIIYFRKVTHSNDSHCYKYLQNNSLRIFFKASFTSQISKQINDPTQIKSLLWLQNGVPQQHIPPYSQESVQGISKNEIYLQSIKIC